MSAKQTKTVQAPLGTQFTQDATFCHLVGKVKVGKEFREVYAKSVDFLTPEQLKAAKITAGMAVALQFFRTDAMTSSQKLEFLDGTKWGLSKPEAAAFVALTDVYQIMGGAFIEEANNWHIRTKAQRQTDTSVVNLAQRVGGYLRHKGEAMPQKITRFADDHARLLTQQGKAKTKGKASSGDKSDAMLKPSEVALAHNALTAAKQASAQVDALTSGKVSKAQKDALTAKLREIIAALEAVTTK